MRGWMKGAAIVAVIGAVCTATEASAGQEEPGIEDGRSFGFNLAGAAQFPVAAGFQGALELPGRLQVYAGGGIVPSQFQSAVNRALVSMNAYDPQVGDFALKHIGDTRVLRAGAGWQPFAHQGLFFQAGYMQLHVNGAVDVHELMPGLSAQSVSGSQAALLSQVSLPTLALSSTLHMADVQAGWEWDLASFFVRASLGAAVTFSANSDLGFVYSDGKQNDLGAFGKIAEGYVNSALVKYARTPFVGLQLGYRVF